MIPKIVKDKLKFEYSASLNEAECSFLQKMKGQKIAGLMFQQLKMVDIKKQYFTCYGPLAFKYFNSELNKWCYTIIYSLFNEINGPIVDQGAMFIKYHDANYNHNSSQIYVPTIMETYKNEINLGNENLEGIQIFGNHFIGNAKDYDPYLNLEFLEKNYNFEVMPTLNLSSLEFLLFTFETFTLSVQLDYNEMNLKVLPRNFTIDSEFTEKYFFEIESKNEIKQMYEF